MERDFCSAGKSEPFAISLILIKRGIITARLSILNRNFLLRHYNRCLIPEPGFFGYSHLLKEKTKTKIIILQMYGKYHVAGKFRGISTKGCSIAVKPE
jgi:hypothetical protein